MPRNVRNFWIEVDAGGKHIATGPQRADGGLDTTIYIREDGAISATHVQVYGRAYDGKVVLSIDVVESGKRREVFSLSVQR